MAVPSGWSIYEGRAGDYAFQLSYPAEAKLMEEDNGSTRLDLAFALGTNLVEKYLQVTARLLPEVQQCSASSARAVTPRASEPTTVRINGLPFQREAFGGVATGNIYDDVAYSIARDSACVTLEFVLHSTNRGNYPTPPPEFDAVAESAVFLQIASSFRWLQQ